MKKVLMAGCCLAMFLCACAEVVWKNLDDSQIAFYRKDREIAKKIWKSDGTIETIGTIPDGIVKHYDDNGTLVSTTHYKNNQAQGVNRIFFGDGKLSSINNLKHDRFHGMCKEYYVNGNVMAEINYKDGKPHGLMKMYYFTGELKEELQFEDGKRDGMRRQYYRNGMVMLEEQYKNDVLDGPSKEYDEAGRLRPFPGATFVRKEVIQPNVLPEAPPEEGVPQN